MRTCPTSASNSKLRSPQAGKWQTCPGRILRLLVGLVHALIEPLCSLSPPHVCLVVGPSTLRLVSVREGLAWGFVLLVPFGRQSFLQSPQAPVRCVAICQSHRAPNRRNLSTTDCRYSHFYNSSPPHFHGTACLPRNGHRGRQQIHELGPSRGLSYVVHRVRNGHLSKLPSGRKTGCRCAQDHQTTFFVPLWIKHTTPDPVLPLQPVRLQAAGIPPSYLGPEPTPSPALVPTRNPDTPSDPGPTFAAPPP